jgi:hypothetical protein
MSNFTNAAYNEKNDVLVKWNSERFVIIGDDRKVSNKALNALIAGEFPKGWHKAPATPAEMIAAGNAA